MSEEIPRGELLEQKINEAIRLIFQEYGGDFVVKWVSVVEAVDEEGERFLQTFTSPDAKRWDIHGLLKDLDNFQIAHQVAEILEAHGHGGCEG